MGLTFDSIPHVYTLDGVELPSVTGVLKASGLINFDQIPPRILQAAQFRGTAVHQAIHYFNERDLDVLNFCRQHPGYAPYLQSWIRLVASGRLKTWFCEYRVASRDHRVAGTIDWLGELDGIGALIDFATGHPDDVAKDLQTGAYEAIAREWSREPGQEQLRAFFAAHPFVRRYAVALKKTGELPTPHPYTLPRDKTDFFALLNAQQIVKARKPKAVDWSEWPVEEAA